MNLRSLLLRTALVVAFFGFAFVTAAFGPRLNPDTRATTNHSLPLILLPLVALPLMHAFLPP